MEKDKKVGRPSRYESHVKPYFKEIREALERGVEENQIAKNLRVSISSWCEYKLKFPEFAELFKDIDRTEILKQLDGALMKAATGFEYKEIKTYQVKDDEGNVIKTHSEITQKVQPPNVTAIFGAYNRFDPNYIKDKAYYDLKQQELELKKLAHDDKEW